MFTFWLLAAWVQFLSVSLQRKWHCFIQQLTRSILHLEYDSLEILLILTPKIPKTERKGEKMPFVLQKNKIMVL